MKRVILHDSSGETLMLDNVWPVGSIYMSVNSTDPGTLFGGTWVRIKDAFLLSAGDTYNAGDIGGEAEHTLTVAEMPSHQHATLNNGKYDATNFTNAGNYMLVAGNARYNSSANTSSVGGGYSTQQYAALSRRLRLEKDSVTPERWCS